MRRGEYQRESRFGSATAGMKCGNAAPYAPGFFRVQIKVRVGEKLFDPLSIATVNRNADTRGEPRGFLVLRHDFTDAVCHLMRLCLLRLWQYESKLIATVARGGIDGPAMNPQDGCQAAKGAAANQMAEAVVDFLQAIKVEEQNSERPPGAVEIGRAS